jgi:hypothetical protein
VRPIRGASTLYAHTVAGNDRNSVKYVPMVVVIRLLAAAKVATSLATSGV